MMRLSTTVSILVLALTTPLYGVVFHASVQAMPGQEPVPADCQASLDELTGNPDWYQQLINPVLTSQAQIDARLDLYSTVHACLSGASVVHSSETENIDTLVQYFLLFVGGRETASSATSLTPVSLGTSADPAVRELRNSIGISPPPGFIYVRSYASREAMPALIKSLFENEAVQGVTVLNRYIAVLSDKPGTPSPWVSKTISHELVHAYVNSASAQTSSEFFPKWYAEGMAVYFSNSAEPSCVSYLSPARERVTECEMATEDYAQYAENFQFLRDALGDGRFRNTLRKSVENHDASLVYRELGIASYDELVQRTDAWHQERVNTRAFKFMGGTVALMFIIGGLIVIVKWVPSWPVWGRLAPAGELAAGSSTISPVRQAPVIRKPTAPPPAVHPTRPATPIPVGTSASLIATLRPDKSPVNVNPAMQVLPQQALPSAGPPRSLSEAQTARATAFWASLPNFPPLLGSGYRLQTVLKMRAQGGGSEWHLDYTCPTCYRRAVLQLPNDISYEQYAEAINGWAKAHGRQAPAPGVILRPYAICLYCGTMFWADRLGIPRPPLPLRV